MTFEEYPVDTQRCNISLESWGHPSEVINNISLFISYIISNIFICEITTSAFLFSFSTLFYLGSEKKGNIAHP